MIEIEHDIKCQTIIIFSLIDKAVGSFLALTQRESRPKQHTYLLIPVILK